MNPLHPDTLYRLHTARTDELTRHHRHAFHDASPPRRRPRTRRWHFLRWARDSA
ncbi:hypothetical protein OG897_30405 [Streptomyces sp. NBC_00237]|uniref:hypothetical protein n=1 Tax=Streptomyces sp. NBC_00237 TaxID=2975687 RepID=UPI0022585A64|nr:hypothetical protein [Streptomyces sp. NBC_00237]MCX5205752.1 hypothetical protein [Streptomyces sp. NBC_00237]